MLSGVQFSNLLHTEARQGWGMILVTSMQKLYIYTKVIIVLISILYHLFLVGLQQRSITGSELDDFVGEVRLLYFCIFD
jgi:hypothetical protein